MASYVLVVDDDPAIRGLVADALREEGFAVDMAAHGREALEAMRARRPATVILDLMMPVMDGFTFIETCRREQLCENIPIVVMSAVHDALRRLKDLDVHAAIAKPFDLDALVSMVGQLVHNHTPPAPRSLRQGAGGDKNTPSPEDRGRGTGGGG